MAMDHIFFTGMVAGFVVGFLVGRARRKARSIRPGLKPLREARLSGRPLANPSNQDRA